MEDLGRLQRGVYKHISTHHIHIDTDTNVAFSATDGPPRSSSLRRGGLRVRSTKQYTTQNNKTHISYMHAHVKEAPEEPV